MTLQFPPSATQNMKNAVGLAVCEALKCWAEKAQAAFNTCFARNFTEQI